jgi:hypothetical protein
MAQPVVHFEIIGKDPEKLRGYFGDLFGWEFDTSAPVAETVSEPTNYGFVKSAATLPSSVKSACTGSVKQRPSIAQSRRSTAIAYLITCSLIWTRSSSRRIRASRSAGTAFLLASGLAHRHHADRPGDLPRGALEHRRG